MLRLLLRCEQQLSLGDRSCLEVHREFGFRASELALPMWKHHETSRSIASKYGDECRILYEDMRKCRGVQRGLVKQLLAAF